MLFSLKKEQNMYCCYTASAIHGTPCNLPALEFIMYKAKMLIWKLNFRFWNDNHQQRFPIGCKGGYAQPARLMRQKMELQACHKAS